MAGYEAYEGYELPNYSAIAPIVPVVYAPPTPSLPSDVYSTPPLQSNPNYDPPSLPLSSPVPPSISYQPPPEATPPPLASPPPPIADSPPPVSSALPPAVSSEPPAVESYTPDSPFSHSPPSLSPPPPSTPPPTSIMSPPPPLAAPPLISPPPPSTPHSLPPAVPATAAPPPPLIYSSPPPPLTTNPPTSSSPPPLVPDPPTNLAPPAPPPLTVEPPISSSLPPVSSSLPPTPPPTVAEAPKSPPPPPVKLSPSVSQSPPSDASPSPTIPFRPHSPSKPDASSHPSLPLPTRPLVPVTQSNSSKSNGITTENVATIAVIAGMFMLAFVGLAVFVRKRRRPTGSGGHAGGFRPPGIGHPQISESSYPGSRSVPLVRYSSGSHGVAYSSPEPGLGHSQLWFTYEELSAITNGFSMQYLLGEGGFGCVFKGCLKDGRQVAVKQLKVGGSQGEREFKAEVEIISRVHHRHLVSLVGYCISEHQRLLVYDYVPNNTLYHHLHVKREPVMSWTTRVKVASGAARGIAYLHEDCHPRIIHRDIKSSNILLNNNFEAQVSDFGLARLAMDACTHVSTRVMGTFGYLAPEYASSGKLTAKSDIYSFGVILLELVTGRKPVDDSQPLGDESLVEWARPLLSNALENGNSGDLPDPRLGKNYNENEMFRMIEAAAACIRHSAARRPRMVQVVRALDSLGDLDLNNGVKPGQSELFSEPQTEEIERFQRMGFGSQGYSSGIS